MTGRCDECGVTHGPGNTNTLCPKASNYRGKSRLEKAIDEAAAMRPLVRAAENLFVSGLDNVKARGEFRRAVHAYRRRGVD